MTESQERVWDHRRAMWADEVPTVWESLHVAKVTVIDFDACICDGKVTRPRSNCWAKIHTLRTSRNER